LPRVKNGWQGRNTEPAVSDAAIEGRITGITRQKKDRNRASIYVEEEFAFGVNEQTIEEFRLRKGDFIDGEIRRKIEEFDSWIDAKRTALAYLNHRSRSEKEIRERLRKETIPEPVIERVVEFLRGYEMVNDDSWSKAFVNDKLMRKSVSSRQLEAGLVQKGVAKEIIAETLKELNSRQTDEDRAWEAATKRWERIVRTESDIRKQKQKLYTFLGGRGFSFEVIAAIYKRLVPHGSDDEIEE
jgi:regulatory protein